MEGGDMPGNVGRDARKKPGESLELFVRIIETGNQEGHDLQPETHVVQALDCVENRLKPPAELPIVAIIEALQVDFVKIDPRSDEFQNLGCAVPVGNKSCH